MWWEELGDDELESRLANRGEARAKELVELRDDEAAAVLITRILDGE